MKNNDAKEKTMKTNTTALIIEAAIKTIGILTGAATLILWFVYCR